MVRNWTDGFCISFSFNFIEYVQQNFSCLTNRSQLFASFHWKWSVRITYVFSDIYAQIVQRRKMYFSCFRIYEQTSVRHKMVSSNDFFSSLLFARLNLSVTAVAWHLRVSKISNPRYTYEMKRIHIEIRSTLFFIYFYFKYDAILRGAVKF